MEQIRLVDTTLRDGQQSLWACRMRAEAMLPAMPDIDAAGYEGIEFAVATAQFPRAIRDLKENPWDWLTAGAQTARSSQLRMTGGIHTRLARVPLSVRKLYFDKMADLGVTVTRTSDPWNDFSRLQDTVNVLGDHGVDTIANLIYSVSPRHTVEYYAQKTREAAAINPYRICFKDVGGLLTPETTRELIPVILENAGGAVVELHTHSNNGLAPYNVLVAAEMGIRVIHTAIPPLANGSSQPSVFSVTENLRARGFEVAIDTEPLRRVSEHFDHVAIIDDLPTGAPAEYDETFYRHQVPGGMASNMKYQLEQLGRPDLLEEALVEVARVREDFGYPIMVTPLAQFVGTQAVVNVIAGQPNQRYATVTDETILYALGEWGKEATTVMDQQVRDLVLSRSRADELQSRKTDDFDDGESLASVRARYGLHVSDEELIVRCFLGSSSSANEVPAPGSPARTYGEYRANHNSIVELVKHVASANGIGRVDVREGDHRITVRV